MRTCTNKHKKEKAAEYKVLKLSPFVICCQCFFWGLGFYQLKTEPNRANSDFKTGPSDSCFFQELRVYPKVWTRKGELLFFQAIKKRSISAPPPGPWQSVPNCKPCSVLSRRKAAIIYLCVKFTHPVSASFGLHQFPYQIWVSRLRGLPVPPDLFPGQLVSVALLKAEHHEPKFLGEQHSRLLPEQHPSLIDWTGTNTTVISDCASMDFPLTAELPAIARQEQNFFYSSVSLDGVLKTASSSLAILFRIST